MFSLTSVFRLVVFPSLAVLGSHPATGAMIPTAEDVFASMRGVFRRSPRSRAAAAIARFRT